MAATNGWDVLKVFLSGVFLIVSAVILLANLNQPKCNVTVTPDQNTLVTVNDIVESNIYGSQLSSCPGVVPEYATYLNSLNITFALNTPCPPLTSNTAKAVGDWTACYPPGQFGPPPQQLLTDLAECGFTITTAAPWALVPQSSSTPQTAGSAPPQPVFPAVAQGPALPGPMLTASSYMPDISYMVV